MKLLDNRKLKALFFRMPLVSYISLAVAILLLGGSFISIWQAFSVVEAKEEYFPLIEYEHQGNYNYDVSIQEGYYSSPSPVKIQTETDTEENDFYVYFTNIIEKSDKLSLSYTYDFSSDGLSEAVLCSADITATVEGPSGWSKEFLITSVVDEPGIFTVYFLIDWDFYNDVINEIENELEVRGGDNDDRDNNYNLDINAKVYIQGKIEDSISMNDTFTQHLSLRKALGVIEVSKDLYVEERNFTQGHIYRHQGNFDYEISLDDNSLYEDKIKTLHPEQPESIPLVIRDETDTSFYTNILDMMHTEFNYVFTANSPFSDLKEEITIDLTLSDADYWAKTFSLVKGTYYSDDVTCQFPVDVEYLAQLSEAIRDEIGIGTPNHDVTIEARVHTTCNTPYGPIDETFVQQLTGILGTSQIVWNGELTATANGNITTSRIVGDPKASEYRLASLVVSPLALIIFVFIFWNVFHAGPLLNSAEEEMQLARKKYRNNIVDVSSVPFSLTEESVIICNSIAEIVKVADNLFKPVLHLVKNDEHWYTVIDNNTRYQYVNNNLRIDTDDDD